MPTQHNDTPEVSELRSIDDWMAINTVFTVLTGLAGVAIATNIWIAGIIGVPTLIVITIKYIKERK